MRCITSYKAVRDRDTFEEGLRHSRQKFESEKETVSFHHSTKCKGYIGHAFLKMMIGDMIRISLS